MLVNGKTIKQYKCASSLLANKLPTIVKYVILHSLKHKLDRTREIYTFKYIHLHAMRTHTCAQECTFIVILQLYDKLVAPNHKPSSGL